MTAAERRNKVTSEERDLIIKMWNEGTLRSEISHKLGRSPHTIRDVLRRLQKAGVIKRRAEPTKVTPDDISRLAERYSVTQDMATILYAFSNRRCTAEALSSFESLLALYCSQKGLCYYTGRRLATDGPNKAVLVSTDGLGKVLCMDIVREFRGKLPHNTFLKMVKAISAHLLV